MTLCQFNYLEGDDGLLRSTPPCPNEATHEGACYGPLVCEQHRCRCACCAPIGTRRATREADATFTTLRAIADVADVTSSHEAYARLRVAEALREQAAYIRIDMQLCFADARALGMLERSAKRCEWAADALDGGDTAAAEEKAP